MAVYFKHTEGSKKGQTESFEKDRIRIGRQSDNDLKFDPRKDLEISGHHAEIYRQGESFFLKDLQSRNGTYLNSKRIDQPAVIADGDVIQFSARGPKMVFFTRGPSAPSGTLVIKDDKAAPAAATGATAGTASWKFKLLIASAVVVLILFAVGMRFLAGWSWWAILLGLSVILVVGFGAFLTWRWSTKRRQRSGMSGQTGEEESRQANREGVEKDNLVELRQRWAEALKRLRGSSLQRRGEDPVYAFPWFVVLGDRGSGKSSAIKAASPLSSIASTADGQGVAPTRNCDWWFFNDLVLLDTTGRYAFPLADGSDGAEWREFLSLLKKDRWREPVNGAVVVLGADVLAGRTIENLKEDAGKLRQRVDEMVRQLGTKFPVYLLIAKSDLIPGFTEFFAALPEAVFGQAMGYANGDPENSAQASGFFEKGFQSICERLNRLRLGLMEEEERPPVLRPLFLFPEEFRSLREPLRAFVDTLFRQSPYQEAPYFRGFFFTSARQEETPVSRLSRALGFEPLTSGGAGTARNFFAGDLMSTILPKDRSLVRRTTHWRERYQLAQVAAFIATVSLALLFSALFTLSFSRNWRALSSLDIRACLNTAAPSAQRPIAASLKPLDGCRQSIEDLNPRSFWKRMAQNFGLRQTRRLEVALRRRFLQTFRASVLEPLDARIDQKLVPGPDAPLQVSALLQRLQLLALCQSQDGCPSPEKWVRPNYRVMLAAEYPGIKDGDPAIGYLLTTHEAYLLWQTDPRVFEDMRAKEMERLKRWLDAGGLKADWILQSASSQFPAVRSRDFWRIDMAAQVDGPYTGRAWQEGIQPLLAGLQGMASQQDVKEAVNRFAADYRSETLRQWERFLVEFPQGEKYGRGRAASRDLALRVLGPDSPYTKVIDAASANLSPLIGNAPKDADVPAWAATLQRYAALKSKTQKAAGADAKGKAAEQERDALPYLSSYADSLQQLRSEISTPEKSFASAKRVFEEGEPTDRAGHPLLKASWNLQSLRKTIGSPTEEDRVFWLLLNRPIGLAWRVMLDEAGGYLQQQWEALWLELADLSPGQKGGKILGFVNGPAAAFLERRGERYAPRKLLNENIVFMDSFLGYLSRLQLLSPDAPVKMDPPRRIIATS